MSEPIYIDRPPRIQPELPFEIIEIPSPPEKDEGGYTQLIQVALPMITIIGYVLVATVGGGGRNPMLLIPMALSVLASVAFSIYTFRKEQQKLAEMALAYTERLVELNKEMNNYQDMQRRFYRYNYPDRLTTFRIVENARREVEKTDRTLRSESRLWERRVTDEDFGVLRLGMGTLPSTVLYQLGEVENFDDPQVREAMKLEEDSKFVSDIPVIINMRNPDPEKEVEEDENEEEEGSGARTPFTHALGIAGEKDSVYSFIRSLMAHYTVFHGPMDSRLYIIASDKKEWEWTDYAPHCQGDEQNDYQCFVNEILNTEKREVAFDEDDEGVIGEFLEGLRKVLATRKIQLSDRDGNEGKGDPRLPFLMVVVDLLDSTYDKKSPLNDLESDAAISFLLEEGDQLGAGVIFLVPERSKVPSRCTAVIEIERTTPATNARSEQNQILHFRYAEVGVNTPRYVGGADYISKPEHLNALAQKLAGMEVRQGFGANLNSAVMFMDMMGYNHLDHLQEDAISKWELSTQAEHANWLRAKLGFMSGNKPRTLTFSAKKDGVHGMVAGSTGSGKSELLISLIIAMAVTYSPTVLNFVLVDYKGGGAFKEFASLPHCVDIITNLEGDAVTRMFTAISSEMQRRQALNAETGTKNIVEYRKKGLHISHKPYPFLFIIIDEFAEMIADRSEYKDELESITRVGRAQGVSLILAAQRPSGVTDQMRSNIKYRISLRVETPGESREMLRRSDAAFLPSGIPGRGYLQVGNEEIELIQVAYSGEKYVDPDRSPRAKVIWPERGDTYDESEDQEPPELYKVIISLLDKVAVDNEVEEQRAPWPDFLPTNISLPQLLVSRNSRANAITSDEYLANVDQIMLGQQRDSTLTLNPSVNKWLNGENGWLERQNWEEYAVRPVIGLVDNPYAAQQLPLMINLPRGHIVAFGASGWGKTTFIRSLFVSLAATHSPEHLHMYVLDLGGRNLTVLEKLPHVGSVIIPDEEGYEERVEQLLRMLDEIVDERKTTLSNASTPDIYRYNEFHPAAPLPAVVVAIDNVVEFKETFDNQKDDVESIFDKFVDLARQAKAYGIHFVVTADRLNSLSNKMFSIFTERLTFKLADPTEYRPIVGGQVADIGDIPGRGYMKIGHLPLTLQVALPISGQSDDGEEFNENKEIEEFASSMQQVIDSSGREYNLPMRVDALPKTILFKQILARKYDLELDESFMTRLEALTRQNWRNSLDPSQADWLEVVMGVISGNRLRNMHFEAKRDGVHGMIAGGTGSGKSELLMTLIVGLALNYDPTVLNFVLVDYKGGGAFKPFEDLPHCVDTITNLNKSAVRRFFTAINAEMQERQRLNAETGTKDIVEYREKGYHLTHEPYPHLFIIIDEYAEMITDSPEYKAELDSITRVGRAQGVNLLLASQRPTGVTDQMRANIKFRICLRVEGIDTSREMLRRSDAAFLPSGMPGRGYLQIGNENIELIQMAYTGEEYPYAEMMEGGKSPKFYDVVVQLCQNLLEKERPRTPWPPFLPTKLTLSSQLIEEYMPEDAGNYEKLFETCYRGEEIRLNPAIDDWFAGNGRWPGVNWNRTAMRAIVGIADNPFGAQQLPLVVDVTKGHVVLFGASGWGKTTFMRTMITSLAATHSPGEFHAHILDLGGRNLEVLRALPHVGTVIMPDERGYEERVQQLLRELNDIVDERKRLFSEAGTSTLYEFNSNHPENVLPAVLVVLDNFAEYIETFGDTGKNSDSSQLEALVLLLRQAKAYGVHFVISANRLNELSNKLYSLFTERLALRLSESGDYRAIVGPGVAEIDEIPGRGFVKVGRQPLEFQIAIPVGEFDEQGQPQNEARQIRALGAKMDEAGFDGREPLRIDALPKTSSFRQVLTEIHDINPERFLDELKSATAETWELNGSAEQADWLKAVLGITSGNRKRELQLEAKKDGVHGLIAGGTGSGKSELLMTMIVGLALNFPPDVLNFVLVDYKGGGAFKPFEKLPHCVDIVTNLNKAAVNRMFAAINAEMRRRQKMNADTGTKDIVEYRKKNLHRTIGPYPHLFIIIDEYAEMIDDNPEYRMELESITRVGRAQGVNLILASQRPKGVTDQMRANIKLRICLRVEQLDTSRELLRRPDAALLPSGMPGRGYMQVGNENLELIQVSWTGEDQPDDREAAVLWPDHPTPESVTDDDETPKVFDAAVKIASELTNHIMAPKPWPSFLPRFFSLQSSITDAQKGKDFTLTSEVSDWLNDDTEHLWPGVGWRENAMRPIAGLVDDPTEAKQYPLQLELHRTHLAVFGDSGWGKTSFLRTIIVSLAATHSPSEFHAYVLDLGGRNFRSIEELPHVGSVIYADEEKFEERLQRLLDKLSRMTDERQEIISNADANNLLEFNDKRPDERMAAVLVAIDNFAELRENYEGLVEGTIMPLVRRSLSVGINFVVTGNTPSNMPSKLYNLFGERITFKQANKDRYMDIVGRGAIELDDIAGRGYIRVGRRPLMLHAALPVGIPDQETGRDSLNEADEIRNMARMMQHRIGKMGKDAFILPEPIDTLQEKIPLVNLLETAREAKSNRILGILGENSSLQTAYFNLRRMGPHFAVVGPPLSGKSTALYNWVFSLADRHSPENVQIILIDIQRRFAEYGGERTLDELPHVLMNIDEAEQLPDMVANLKTECTIMAESEDNREIFVIIDNFDDLVEEIERERDLPRDLSVLARRYGRDGLHFIIAGTLDSSNELRRRVQQSNYGLGLRSASAVDTLRVMRRPAALRNKELNVGRGFIVVSGMPTMMQVASPYDGMGVELPAGADLEEEEERNARTLDLWVDRICKKYPDIKAEWASPEAVMESGAGGTSIQSKEALRMFTVLQQAMQHELSNYKGDNGGDELVTMQLLQLDMQNWGNEEILAELVKQVWRKTTSLSPEMADMMIDSYDTDSMLMEIEQVVNNGQNGAEGETA